MLIQSETILLVTRFVVSWTRSLAGSSQSLWSLFKRPCLFFQHLWDYSLHLAS